MTHIKKINEMMHKDFSEVRSLLDGDDFSVIVVEAKGNTTHKAGDIIETIYEFVYDCKEMAETCNGTAEISGDDDLAYNMCITDENDNMYASIMFRLVFFDPESIATIQDFYDSVESDDNPF